MVIDFKEKVAVVTGGAGGIGAACVKELLDSNAKVAVVDMSEEALQKLQEKFGAPENMKCYQLDVTKVDDIKATVQKIREEMGEIEVLVQAAGLMRGQNGLDMKPEEWDLMFQINTKGLFFMMQQVVAQSMTKTGGSIVNFSSMAGIRGMREGMESPHYSASKGAVAAMSRQAATEWAKYQVRCNAVAPGGVMTEAMKKMEFPDGAMDPIPLRRLSEPKDIANAVVFLASEQAGMITGQTIVIDGEVQLLDIKKNNSGLKAAILTMSFIQMATNAVSSILANIAMEFPETSVTTIQYLMTFPNLMIVAVSVIAAGLAERISKRTLAATGLLLAAVSGVLSFVLHGSIIILYVWAGMLGIGVGLVVPMANSLISDYFQGNERDAMLGYQTGAANAGSMIMTYVGGILATIAWQFDYLVYLLAIPGLILTLMFVPKQNVAVQDKNAKEKKKFKIEAHEVLFCIVAAVYMLLFYLGPTNIALYFSEKQIGNTMTAGTASSLLLLGGVLMGFFFGKLAEKIGKHTITLGFLALFIGYTLIYIKGQLVPVYIGCVFVGMSNPLVMPQCMGSVVSEDKQRTTVMMSVVFAIANLGTFLAPAITTVSRMVMHAETAASRFAFAGIVTGILACVSFVWIQVSRCKTRAVNL